MFSPAETDAQCWERMVALQREYRCYNSARLEAAVEARDRGREEEVRVREFLPFFLLRLVIFFLSGEMMGNWLDGKRVVMGRRERGKRPKANYEIASRLCLDLMNESLKAWIDAHREGLVA